MANFDDMRLAVESLSGGKNTVILDDLGMPSVVVLIPQIKSVDVLTGATDTVHPAFIVNGVEKTKVAVSKYQNIVYSNRAYSLPGQDPKATVTADQARTYCRNKGEGWGLMPFSLWSAIALWCKKNGTQPHGNNNYGKDVTYSWERGIPSMALDGSGRPQRCATGSGPATWYHDHTQAGIADLNGNVSEWCDGMRLVQGEIQIIPYANCMMPTADMSATSTEWKAIKEDGSLVAPGTSGTLKYDFVSSKVTLATTITSQEDSSRNSAFQSMVAASGVTVPQLIKELALFPADADGYESDQFYINNGADERFPHRGGGWGSPSYAGVFYSVLYNPRSNSGYHIGFRSAFYG